MTDETTHEPKSAKVISLVHSKKEDKEEVVEESELDESLEWLQEFISSVTDKMIREATSPITGISVVLTHRDGGVSHAHKCERESLMMLIGAMDMKKLRLMSSFDQK